MKTVFLQITTSPFSSFVVSAPDMGVLWLLSVRNYPHVDSRLDTQQINTTTFHPFRLSSVEACKNTHSPAMA
jgi:hypothetical protein